MQVHHIVRGELRHWQLLYFLSPEQFPHLLPPYTGLEGIAADANLPILASYECCYTLSIKLRESLDGKWSSISALLWCAQAGKSG